MIKNKKAEFTMKDYVMIGLCLLLIVVATKFIITDFSFHNEGVGENVDISQIEKFYDEGYMKEMDETSKSRLAELEDPGFFKTLFLTMLELVETLPKLATMTIRSLGSILGLFSGTGVFPQPLVPIISVILFMGLLWAVVYFIRRLGK